MSVATKWERLFGTPERAARTLNAVGERCCDRNNEFLPCGDCPILGGCDTEEAMFEWLESEDDMSEFYRFPAMARLGEFTNNSQVIHIESEASEAISAQNYMDYGSGSGDREADRTAYGMELMDVIHAAETALRMEFDDDEVAELRDAVEAKNRKRGYYDER